MSRKRFDNELLILSFPRVSGDEPLKIISVVSSLAFSPRERG